MEAKICGVQDKRTLSYIVNHNYPPKFVGFICNYKKSIRYIKNIRSLSNSIIWYDILYQR